MMKLKKDSQKGTMVNFVGIAVLFAALLVFQQSSFATPYMRGILIQCCYVIIMVTSLNIPNGFMGQFSLGHVGFMAVGAYTSALVTKALVQAGVPYTGLPGYAMFLIAVLVGALVAGLFGLMVSVPALRLRGDYLAIITLGFGEIIRVIIQNIPIAGGKGLAEGQAGQPLIGIKNFSNMYVIVGLTIVCVALMYAFVRSKYGRAIKAIRDDEIASEAAGINTTYYKVLAFTVSAFFAGVAGAIFAHRGLGTLQTSDFTFVKSTEYVLMVVLGGMGSLTGSIIAAVVLSILPEVLRAFAQYRMLIYAFLLVLMMLFRPIGLCGTWEFSLLDTVRGIFKRKPKTPPAAAVVKSEEVGEDA